MNPLCNIPQWDPSRVLFVQDIKAAVNTELSIFDTVINQWRIKMPLA